jgi:ABC transporter transmembrane region
MPLFSLIFGGILDAFNGFDAERRVDQYSLYFLYLAIASFLLNVGMSCCFSISSERQIRRMRLVSTLVPCTNSNLGHAYCSSKLL